jgi:hypothetical protein
VGLCIGLGLHASLCQFGFSGAGLGQHSRHRAEGRRLGLLPTPRCCLGGHDTARSSGLPVSLAGLLPQ